MPQELPLVDVNLPVVQSVPVGTVLLEVTEQHVRAAVRRSPVTPSEQEVLGRPAGQVHPRLTRWRSGERWHRDLDTVEAASVPAAPPGSTVLTTELPSALGTRVTNIPDRVSTEFIQLQP